jgi:uncharacterized DUF497 family protein
MRPILRIRRYLATDELWFRLTRQVLFCCHKNLDDADFCGYTCGVEIEFDPRKDSINGRKHRISLAVAGLMDLDKATVSPDLRFAYCEDRFRAWGLIGGVLHVMAFTMRGEAVRVISLRKANSMENRRHGKAQAAQLR